MLEVTVNEKEAMLSHPSFGNGHVDSLRFRQIVRYVLGSLWKSQVSWDSLGRDEFQERPWL